MADLRRFQAQPQYDQLECVEMRWLSIQPIDTLSIMMEKAKC